MLPPSRTLKYKNLLGGIYMSRKSKIDPALKVQLVERYLNGEISIMEAGRLAGLAETTKTPFRKWVNIYRNEGPTGLLPQPGNRHYSKDLKLQAVRDYLDGLGSLQDIASKYGLRSTTQLIDWLKQYNTHGDIISRTSGGGSYMKKARKTTPEERLEIVKYCLSNDRNFGAAALKYECSYQQVRNWVLRYEKMGEAGLEDRRGHRAGTQPSRTPEEELRDKIAELERKNRDLQMENDLLKKVRELEMKDRYL